MKSILLILAAVLLTPIAAHSAPDEQVVQTLAKRSGLSPEQIRESYNACDSGITLSMKICGAYQFTEQDIRLNLLYKQALTKAKQQGFEEALVKAQRAWLSYRDIQCPFEGRWYAEGGTAEGVYVLSCKIDLTKQQADRVEALVKD